MNRPEDLHEHVQNLHRFAVGLAGNPTDAEDLVQECLRRVLDHLDRNGQIRNLRAYLFQTLRNVHVDQCRKLSTHGSELPYDQDGVELLSVRAGQEDRIKCADIASALERIPEAQREVLLLVCLEDMSYEEVAHITKTPIGTVRSRLHRGRAALHGILGPETADIGYGHPPQRINDNREVGSD